MTKNIQILLLLAAVLCAIPGVGQSMVTLAANDIVKPESRYMVSSDESLTAEQFENLLGLIQPGVSVTYPHPESSMVKIVKNISEGETYDFKVVNQMGQVLESRIFESAASESREFEFNLSKLKDGWYFLRVSTGSGDFESYRILKAQE